MKTYRLDTELWLPQPRGLIFKFFADPANIEPLTPAWLHFEILTPANIELRQGTLLDYRLRLRGIPLRWQSVIAEWDPPRRFVDRQTRGPFSLWVHEHSFSEHNGGTLVGDRVEYAVPGGALTQKYLVAPDLERLFKYRHQVLDMLFNSKGPPAPG
jgi:ligand-binding SRPBCC domain-containing protein